MCPLPSRKWKWKWVCHIINIIINVPKKNTFQLKSIDVENLGIYKNYCISCESQNSSYLLFRHNKCNKIWTVGPLLAFAFYLVAKQSSNNPFFLGWNHSTRSWQTFSGGVTPGPGNQCTGCSQIGHFIIPSPGTTPLLRRGQFFPSHIISYYYIIQFSNDSLGFWRSGMRASRAGLQHRNSKWKLLLSKRGS